MSTPVKLILITFSLLGLAWATVLTTESGVSQLPAARAFTITRRIYERLDSGGVTDDGTEIEYRDSEGIPTPKSRSGIVDQTKQKLSVPVEDLKNAPSEIVLDNRSLHLSTYPWRDFMQGADGSPLMVVLKVTSADNKPLPSGVRMDRAWVLFGEQTWEVSDFREITPGQDYARDLWRKCPDAPVCEATIRGGPKWGPGIYVDVVVRLTDSKGQHHLLQARRQSVSRST